jgi:DNA-binding transcriptional regulator YhcF (GntR family)
MSFPSLRNRILDAIRDLTDGTVSPSVRQIAQHVGSSTTPIYNALEQMRDDKMISWTPGRACSFVIVREGPPREQIERWSDAELSRVQAEILAVMVARGTAKGRAAA